MGVTRDNQPLSLTNMANHKQTNKTIGNEDF